MKSARLGTLKTLVVLTAALVYCSAWAAQVGVAAPDFTGTDSNRQRQTLSSSIAKNCPTCADGEHYLSLPEEEARTLFCLPIRSSERSLDRPCFDRDATDERNRRPVPRA